MNTSNEMRAERGEINRHVAIAIVIAAVIVLALIWVATREPEPESAPIPAPGRPVETVQPAESPVQRGDSAREVIDEISAQEGRPDYARAYARAHAFQAEGRLADAQLLYFFAARGGHAEAAFDLATFQDPNHFSQSASLMDEADAFQAYRWYREAADAGHASADDRLAELRAWAERSAGNGDAEAERLLLQWE